MPNLVNRVDGIALPGFESWTYFTVWRAAWGRTLSRCTQTPRYNIPRHFFSNDWLNLLPPHITVTSTNFIQFSQFLCELPLNVPPFAEFPLINWLFPQHTSFPEQYFRPAVSKPLVLNSHKIFVIQNIADSHGRVVSTLWFQFQCFAVCRTV